MEERLFDFYKGLTQIEYLQNKVQLAGFKPIESNWEELFRWIMSISRKVDFYDKFGNKNGTVGDLWYNHIFTVLIEIKQKKIEEKKELLIKGMGKKTQNNSFQGVDSDIESWLERVRAYLQVQMLAGENPENNSAVKVAHSIEKQLGQALYVEGNHQGNGPDYALHTHCCNMLNTISDIKNQGDFYLQQVEESGDMDPGLSLLLTFIRNYSTIIKEFNQRFTALPEWFHDHILMVSPQKTIQDRAFLSISPTDSVNGFYLPPLTQFIAGKKEDGTELLYQTEKEEYISGMDITQMFTVFQKKEERTGKVRRTFHKHKMNVDGTSVLTLFPESKDCTEYVYGWAVESGIFLLNEGEVTIHVNFLLTPDSVTKLAGQTPNDVSPKAFSVYVSDAEGWRLMASEIKFETIDKKEFITFTSKGCKIDVPLVRASRALHQLSSEYPVVKILANNEECPYDWAKLIEFKEVRIDLEVEHVRGVNVYNELGDIDISKPFYPFGMQAGQGAWFRFGNDEIIRNNLTLVEITGTWNRLPRTTSGYQDIYQTWFLDKTPAKYNELFKVKCERLVKGKWEIIGVGKKLFETKNNTVDDAALIKLELTESACSLSLENTSTESAQTEVSDNCPFRITLDEPAIGFGSEEYRNVFAERMVAKSKDSGDKLPLPIAPLIPMLADMELAYKAYAKIDLSNKIARNDSIRLSRITDLSEYELIPVAVSGVQPFFIESDAEHKLYLKVQNVYRKQVVRIYFDLVFIAQNLFKDEQESNDKSPALEWCYMYNNQWELLDSKYILNDETHGFTQKGFIEIEFPGKIDTNSLDSHEFVWLKAHFLGEVNNCLSIRHIYTDYISVVAINGDGSSIPAMTIKQPATENSNIKNVIQPLPGYGGRVVESRERSAVRQNARIANRNRALTLLDYEQLILEHYPEIGKACCLPSGSEKPNGTHSNSDIRIVVFSYTEDNEYPVTPTWKLDQIKKYISNFISSYANISIINPIYQVIKIKCVASVRREVSEKGEVMRRMLGNIQSYYAPWIQKRTFPDLGRQYSFKSLHNILANDRDVVDVFELTIEGVKMEDVDVDKEDRVLSGKNSWSVLITNEIDLQLLLNNGGIENLMIEYNFKIN